MPSTSTYHILHHFNISFSITSTFHVPHLCTSTFPITSTYHILHHFNISCSPFVHLYCETLCSVCVSTIILRVYADTCAQSLRKGLRYDKRNVLCLNKKSEPCKICG